MEQKKETQLGLNFSDNKFILRKEVIVQAVVKPMKERKKRIVLPENETITHLKWEIEKELRKIKDYEVQDETGWDTTQLCIKGKDSNIPLCRNHILYYQRIIDQKREPYNIYLNKWKQFLIQLCKEREKEIDVIWFEDSSPYDSQVSIRLKGHKCYYACVEFRFQEGILKAYDSHFDSGTTFCWFNFIDIKNNKEEEKIREVMEKVFNMECSDSSWEDRDDSEQRKIEIDEMGWLKITI